MAISANNMSNIFLRTYLSKINNESNTPLTSNSSAIEQEKLVQQFAFQMIFQQMTDSIGNTMMSDLVSTALTGDNSYNDDNSLGLMSNLNSNIRNISNLYNEALPNRVSKKFNYNELGFISSKYESNLNPGAISNNAGDYGGKSYGAWQLSSKTGSLNSFINWLKESNDDYYSKLSDAKDKDGNSFSINFDSAWTEIAKLDENRFLKVQQQYIEQAYYNKAAETLKSKYNFDIGSRSNALKESLWSTVVQHGVGGALSIFSKIDLKNSDKNIINDIYNERQKVDVYFRSSSTEIKQSVYNRFVREKEDMINMLKEDINL